jgi:hypothetical protein
MNCFHRFKELNMINNYYAQDPRRSHTSHHILNIFKFIDHNNNQDHKNFSHIIEGYSNGNRDYITNIY